MATLLTFEDLTREPDYINIFGERYEFVSADQFGLEEQQQLARMARQVEEAYQYDTDPNAVRKAKKTLRELVGRIVPGLKGQEELLNRLGDNRLTEILEVFMSEVLQMDRTSSTSKAQTRTATSTGQSQAKGRAKPNQD